MPNQVREGAVCAGRYLVGSELGRGGMGVVTKGTCLRLNRQVALKFFPLNVAENQAFFKRFVGEAQIVAGLETEHVVRVLDVDFGSDPPFIVMELIDGADLSHPGRATLSSGAIVDLMLQACEGLAEAHARGVIHRDIKPSNLLLKRNADGERLLKIGDFGVARSVSAQLTGIRDVVGTFAYMSPEQSRSSHDVDQRTDIYSLGCVFHELLDAIVVPRPTTILRRELDAIVSNATEADPGKRFSDVAAFAEALAPYAKSKHQAEISVHRAKATLAAHARRPLSNVGRVACGASTRARALMPTQVAPLASKPAAGSPFNDGHASGDLKPQHGEIAVEPPATQVLPVVVRKDLALAAESTLQMRQPRWWHMGLVAFAVVLSNIITALLFRSAL